ncbi:MAG: hypothetical protein GF384_07520 [Elusimicrobia bacterium]|nr:hypothetical protein [Elusimicrobiota bacterium]MBD3412499.1 hypothetical protein [Elusimicrobiota bacterium]
MADTAPQLIAETKVTYFIGKLLAKAGTLKLQNDGLVFIPTALDRAIGSIDIPIPIDDIQEFFYTEWPQKTLNVKTPSKIHKFIGAGLNELHENLIVLKRQLHASAKQNPISAQPITEPTSSITCYSCKKPIKKDFKFCPFCRTQLKNLCPSCKSEVENIWLACPFCSQQLRES